MLEAVHWEWITEEGTLPLAAFFVRGFHSAGGPVPLLRISLLLNCPHPPGNPPLPVPAPTRSYYTVCLQAWLVLITLPVDIHATFSSHLAI